MKPHCLAVLLLAIPVLAQSHGGVPPADIPGYPGSALDPLTPNRTPFCDSDGANGPCGVVSSCLRNEPAEPLQPGQNQYAQGQLFEIPWLLSIVHGNGNLIDVWLRHVDSGREDLLVTGFPQGDGLSQGDVIVIENLAIPVDFPLGAAVIEVGNDTGNDTYFDCADLEIGLNPDFVFLDGLED